LISLSSVILIIAFVISMNLPSCDKCYNELGPLCLVGLAYSIYAAAIWGSIPYVVLPHTVGTAFGLAMAVQNIGLSFAPSIVAYIKDSTTRMYGYYYVEAFFILVNIIGLTCNIALYYVDIKYNNGILDKVDKGDGL
jgi:MFS family permease